MRLDDTSRLAVAAFAIVAVVLAAVTAYILITDRSEQAIRQDTARRTLEAREKALRAEQEKFQRLSPAEHLKAAKEALDQVVLRPEDTWGNANRLNLVNAHLRAIPASAPESREATDLRPTVDAAMQIRAGFVLQQQGEAQAAAALEAERQRQQRQRDLDAKSHSYWPTTRRVDTDMDSSWLPEEERTCQTHPGAAGKVAAVVCDPEGTHSEHNIPVKFWGGVDRDTVSDWKCRREKDLLVDQFVCKAID